MKLYVGQTRVSGGLGPYAERFSLVELRAEPARLPRRAKLRSWAEEAPDGFVFALALPPAVFEGGAAAEEALAYALGVQEVLSPGWWVLRTPASLRPTTASRRAIAELVERLPGGRVAWEPAGPWDPENAERTSRELGVHLVRDGSRDDLPAGDVVYTRLRALGDGTVVGYGAAERLAERLAGRREAWVVVEGQGAGRVREVLAELEDEEPG